MTGDERISHLENRIDSNEKTMHEHMLEDARVLAQIPHQLEALKEGNVNVRDDVRGVREDIKVVRDTLEIHSSKIMTLEQAPDKAAASLQRDVGGKILDIILRWGVPAAIIAVFAYFGSSSAVYSRSIPAAPAVLASPR